MRACVCVKNATIFLVSCLLLSDHLSASCCLLDCCWCVWVYGSVCALMFLHYFNQHGFTVSTSSFLTFSEYVFLFKHVIFAFPCCACLSFLCVCVWMCVCMLFSILMGLTTVRLCLSHIPWHGQVPKCLEIKFLYVVCVKLSRIILCLQYI